MNPFHVEREIVFESEQARLTAVQVEDLEESVEFQKALKNLSNDKNGSLSGLI